MNDSPIGIMDSGLGGLSIWKSITELLPFESTLYVGDHGFVPYGTKSQSAIRKRVVKILGFMREEGIKLAVIACNTATVAGITWYREQMPSFPIIGVVPVVKTGAEMSKHKKFAVLCTRYTAKSQYLQDLINRFAPDCDVVIVQAPRLVQLVEKGLRTGKAVQSALRKIVTSLDAETDIIVLGSTHFSFLGDSLSAVVDKNITIIDSRGAVSRHVKRILEARNAIRVHKVPHHKFVTTGDGVMASKVASKLLGMPLSFQYAKL